MHLSLWRTRHIVQPDMVQSCWFFGDQVSQTAVERLVDQHVERTAGIMLLQRILGEVKYFCVSVEKRWLKWLYFKAVCGRSENHCCSHMHRPLGCSELTTAAPPVGKSQESQNSSSLHQKSDCHTDTNQTHMFWLPLSITFEMCSAQLMVTDITDAHHGCISVCTPEGLCCWCSLNE